jgi:hypothetical protein
LDAARGSLRERGSRIKDDRLLRFFAHPLSNDLRLYEREGTKMSHPTEAPKPLLTRGAVHCPICTHNVDADIVQTGRRVMVKPGQKCPRCSSTLDVAYIIRFDRAA